MQHPFLKIGSNKKIAIKLIPDYSLKVEDNFAWVLDAKAPNESVTNDENIEQVYSYATHPEIRSTYFALCNGLRFSLYRRESTNEPILEFALTDIEHRWKDLKLYLSPDSFQVGKNFIYEPTSAYNTSSGFDYKTRPLPTEIVAKKQAAKRHFGVHGYFTKQVWNVVAEYIKNFSKPGDLILDPFGGSGITAVEALMNDRKAIHIDLNPMSVFMVQSLIAPVKREDLINAFERVKKAYEKNEPNSDDEIKKAIEKYEHPTGLSLPKGSDVATIEDLFTDKQLAQLGYLKYLIKKEPDENIQKSLLLAFSSSLNKFNRTFHYTKSEGGGDSAPFRYYRYRIAPDPGDFKFDKYF